ncbi:hypothetical protein [Micromonospora humi]|uniref:Glutathionylspermidine synthase preATP-grasp n=1 Tax=Micromonospora humi TaxID=745366 RepID=A0A1C5JQW8_9ACTN|nr:hypothetical protein [Micromonospora humi]SCG72396.1 hypothetical protein GA0070213_112179 [Micromonospora humi]
MLSDVVAAYAAGQRAGELPKDLSGIPVSTHFRRARQVDPLASRPFFVDRAEAARTADAVRSVFGLLDELTGVVFGGDRRAYGRMLGLTERQIDLVERTHRGGPAVFCRADLYHDGTSFHLLEMNASSALGGMYFTELNRGLLGDRGFAAFAARHGLGFVDPVASVAAAVRGYLGRPDARLRVGLIDWPSSFVASEPNLRAVAALLAESGIEAYAGHVGQVTADPSGLRLAGVRLDAVYRFFTLGEIERTPGGYDLVEPLVRAHEEGTVPLFLPLSQSLYGNKRSLGLLSAELDRLAPARTAAVADLLPWVRSLTDGEVRVGGAWRDMLAYCREHRTELVLKGAAGYGGNAVLPGWSTGRREWEAALSAALRTPHVVQRRVRPALHTVDDAPWSAVWGLYVVDGYAGCRVRTRPRADADVIALASYGACVFHRESAPPSTGATGGPS